MRTIEVFYDEKTFCEFCGNPAFALLIKHGFGYREATKYCKKCWVAEQTFNKRNPTMKIINQTAGKLGVD